MAHILLVEDDTTLRDMYKTKFELEGYEVSTASNGEEGLQQFSAVQPNIVLLDLIMPKMGGVDFLQKLRETIGGQEVPVIILTNLEPSPDIMQVLHRNNPAYYLVKSNTTPEEILGKVKEVSDLYTPPS